MPKQSNTEERLQLWTVLIHYFCHLPHKRVPTHPWGKSKMSRVLTVYFFQALIPSDLGMGPLWVLTPGRIPRTKEMSL